MGQFNQARQSMFSISEAYTGNQRPPWASLTRPGNPCFQFLRFILGLRDHHGPVLPGPAIHVFNFCGLNWASEATMGQLNQARHSMFSISEA